MPAATEEEVEAPPLCPNCDNEFIDAHIYMTSSEDWCTDCAFACVACSSGYPIVDRIRVDDYRGRDRSYCQECAFRCESCGDAYPNDEGNYIDDMAWYCTDCSFYCDGCDEYWVGEGIYVDGLTVCDDCRNSCEQCGGWIIGEGYDESFLCRHCATGGGGTGTGDHIEGYAHTRAEMWLRLPEQPARVNDIERYYLGFELEISATGENYRGGPIKDWAEEHLGDRRALACKEDSSVAGFEIASQPMTPEYFESIDWESFFTMLNENYPLRGEEPSSHGLHVHIGRVAFYKDDISVAAYSYLLAQGKHLERIGRREPYHYCEKVTKPVSVAIISSQKADRQAQRLRGQGFYAGRDAINLQNPATIEIRAFKSTRNAEDLRAAVRLTYVAAEYVRHLRSTKVGTGGRNLHWSEFARWVGEHYPLAFANIAGLETPKK